ncbi:MAG: hypothetical protein ACKO2G_08125 [Verrucomicrobiales bacterium]
MNELIKLVQEKTGMGEDAARSAIETVAGFLRGKLPAQIQPMVDKVLAGESLDSLGGGMLDAVKGLFGGDKA